MARRCGQFHPFGWNAAAGTVSNRLNRRFTCPARAQVMLGAPATTSRRRI